MHTAYAFTVKGVYKSGIKAKFSGKLNHEDGYPWAAFELAKQSAEALHPGLTVDMSKSGNVTLRRLKGKPK